VATCLFRKSPKNAQHSNVLVVNKGQSGDSLLRICSELAGLVGDEVADFRLIEPVEVREVVPIEPMPEPISVVVPGAHFIATAEIITLPAPVRGRRRAMWMDSPLRDFMLAVPVRLAATG
jgi:hypothetical protein